MQNEFTLRQIVGGISAPLAVMNPDGAFEIANREIMDYFGQTAEELKDWTSTDAVELNRSTGCASAGLTPAALEMLVA